MLDADANISLVALAISLLGLGVASLQALQQYVSTAYDYRHCSAQCMGGWSRRTKRRFILRELRFEVQYSVPHISLYWLFTKQTDPMGNPITLDRPLYCLWHSLDANDTLFFVYRGPAKKHKPWRRFGGKRIAVALREDELWFVRGEQAHPQARCFWLSLLEECTLTNIAFHIREVRHSRDYDFEGAIRQINRPMATADRRAFLVLMSLFRTKWSPDAHGTLLGTGPDFQISTIEVPSIGTVYKYSKLHFTDDKEIGKKLDQHIAQEPVSMFSPSLWIKYFVGLMEGIIQVGFIDAIMEFYKGLQRELPDLGYRDSPEPNTSDSTSNNNPQGKTPSPRPKLYLVRAHWSPRDCPELLFVKSIPQDQLTLIRLMFNHFELPFMTLRTSSSEEVKQSILGVFTNPDLAEAVSKRRDDGCYPGIGELVACWGFPSMPRVVNEVSDSFMTVFSASSLSCPLGIPQIGNMFLGKSAQPADLLINLDPWSQVLYLVQQFWLEFDDFLSSQESILEQLRKLYPDLQVRRTINNTYRSADSWDKWDKGLNLLYGSPLKYSDASILPGVLYLLDYYFDIKLKTLRPMVRIDMHRSDSSFQAIMSRCMLDIASERAKLELERKPNHSVTNPEQVQVRDMAEDTIKLVKDLPECCSAQGSHACDEEQAGLMVINRLVRGVFWILHNGNAPGKKSKTTIAGSDSEDRSLECSLSSSVLDESAGAMIYLA